MRINLLISSFLIFLGLSCSSQKYMGEPRPVLQKPSCGKQLYLCLQGLGSGDFKAYAKDNKINEVILVGRKYIDPDKDGVFNKIEFLQRLTELFPNRLDEAIVMLDWEGKHYKAINKNKGDSPEFRHAEKRLIEVLSVAKNHRPNVKFGFYAIPGRKYWKITQEWKEKYSDFVNIANASDILFPSLYLLYSERDTNEKGQLQYVQNNVTRALALGVESNRPVYPVIWHRYAVGNKKRGLSLVPLKEMKKHVKQILEVHYEKKKAESLVWWGSDRYYYNIKQKNVLKEVFKNETFEEYFSRYYFSYLYEINKLIVYSCSNTLGK